MLNQSDTAMPGTLQQPEGDTRHPHTQQQLDLDKSAACHDQLQSSSKEQRPKKREESAAAVLAGNNHNSYSLKQVPTPPAAQAQPEAT